METVHNVINLCALFDVDVDATCTSNAVHKVPNLWFPVLQEKVETSQGSHHQQVTSLEDELAQVKAYRDELQKYIRELEQSNDDLERTKRCVCVCVCVRVCVKAYSDELLRTKRLCVCVCACVCVCVCVCEGVQ